MMGLTDSQLAAVMDAARILPVEKRDIYLQRIAAMLTMRGRGHFNDADVSDVAKLALTGLALGTVLIKSVGETQAQTLMTQSGHCGNSALSECSLNRLRCLVLKGPGAP